MLCDIRDAYAVCESEDRDICSGSREGVCGDTRTQTQGIAAARADTQYHKHATQQQLTVTSHPRTHARTIPFKKHRFDLNMMGMRPMGMRLAISVVLPREYRTSTVTTAEYVKSRSRHSCGKTFFSAISSFTEGAPTLMFIYRRKNFGSDYDSIKEKKQQTRRVPQFSGQARSQSHLLLLRLLGFAAPCAAGAGADTYIAAHFLVRLHYVFQLHVNEVIERVNVLLHQTTGLQPVRYISRTTKAAGACRGVDHKCSRGLRERACISYRCCCSRAHLKKSRQQLPFLGQHFHGPREIGVRHIVLIVFVGHRDS